MDADPQRIKVLWKKGQNYFTSMFAELAKVRQDCANDAEFADWCFFKLRISLSFLEKVAEIFQKADAERIKQEMAIVKRAEREARRIEAERKRQERDQAAIASAERRKQLRQLKAETAAIKADMDAKQEKAQRQQKRRQYYPEENKRRRIKIALTSKDANALGQQARELLAELEKLEKDTHAQWVKLTMILGEVLITARQCLPANKDFGEWLDQQKITLGHSDRAALLKMAVDPERMHQLLLVSPVRSYQLLWREHGATYLQIVPSS